jgi:hypothetical protein
VSDANENSDGEDDIYDDRPDVEHWIDAIHELDLERPSSDSPYLNETDIKDILSGSDGYNGFDRDDADEALADIKKRWNRLLVDIALLSHGGYLDDIDKIWNYLKPSPDHMGFALRYAIERGAYADHDDFCFNLGFNTGLAFSELTGTASEDDRGARFLDGFTEAYKTNWFRGPSEVVEEIDRPQERVNDLEVPPEVAANTPDDSIQNASITQDDVFKRHNISSSEYLRQVISYYQKGINDLMSESELSLAKVTEIFLKNTDHWFEKCCTARRGLDEEWESIDDAAVPGPAIETVLESFWTLRYRQEQISIKSKNIRNEFGGKQGYKGSVTQILNQLSEDGKNPSKEVETKYKHNEIVSYSDGWKLTDYGRLLFYHVFEKDQRPQWIHEASLQIPLPYDETNRWSDHEVKFLVKGVCEFLED